MSSVKRLPRSFAERDATVVAPELLNKLFVAHGTAARITEVEAYTADDAASHSFRGPTKRNAMMFGPAGCWYVYLIYGMHYCLNLVTGKAGDGQAVLIRAVAIEGVPFKRSTGPGRLTRELGIDLSLNGAEAELFDDGTAPPKTPLVTPRIGITKAVELRRRWLLAD
ncbi:MAG: DNA-3-methyladenine glycosylase [Vicinamibacterales bacterium]